MICLAVDDAVGDVEQTIDELAVGGVGEFVVGCTGLAVRLDDECARGSGGDDDGVLDLFGFHQGECFGAEVVTAV
jgi:hypothetical protein